MIASDLIVERIRHTQLSLILSAFWYLNRISRRLFPFLLALDGSSCVRRRDDKRTAQLEYVDWICHGLTGRVTTRSWIYSYRIDESWTDLEMAASNSFASVSIEQSWDEPNDNFDMLCAHRIGRNRLFDILLRHCLLRHVIEFGLSTAILFCIISSNARA